MPRFLTQAALAALAAVPALSAQQNPFKPLKSAVRSVAVSYQYTGDLSGTGQVVMDGERLAMRSQTTMKILGKTVTVDDWSLTTPDSIYRVDFAKKVGTVSPNPVSLLAKAYDDLDGGGRKRFHQNMQGMAGILARGFNLAQLAVAGEKGGKRTVAGQECEERSFMGLSICTMERTPIVLHTRGSLLCFAFEQTATEVRLGAATGEAFAPPGGIAFVPDPRPAMPDSMARGFVNYLASEALADSLARAKEALEKLRAEAAAKGQAAPQVDPAQMEAVCQAVRDFDMGKVMADASTAWKRALAEEAKNAAKNAAVGGLKGLLKRPKIP